MSAAKQLVAEVSVRVYDRGPEPEWHTDRKLFGPWYPYEAEVVDYPAVQELGMTPWDAVHRIVANHRALLERRWSPERTAR